jgi:hypothetical protein
MAPFQATIGLLALGALLVLLTGMVKRRRYNAAYLFTIYLAVVFVTELMMFFWPGTFYKKTFYLQKENVINALRFGVALELLYRTFRAFPSAHRLARGVVFTLLVGTLVLVLVATQGQPDAHTMVNKIQPWVINASVWLFTALAGLILWYRLPVDAFQKAILVGWVPYLLVFSAALTYVGDYGADFITVTNYVHTLAYLGLLVYWARMAWQPARVSVSVPAVAPMPPATLQRSLG